MLADICSEQDRKQLEALWDIHFGEEASTEYAFNVLGADAADGDLYEDLGDLGTEVETKKSADELAGGLHFTNHRPALFNERKFLYTTLDLWDDERAKLMEEGSLKSEELKLEWVQLAGIAAIVRQTFEDKPSEQSPSGILIADTVGMGKSAMVMGFLSLLMQLVEGAGRENSGVPPMVGEF